MFDMNLYQLQYVADHITLQQCRKLSEALTLDGVLLDHPVSGADEKDLSCIRLLLLYDRSDKGRGKSFVDVSIRLRQIGRPDVAEQLSEMVYKEKAKQVQKSILDNPFKNQIEADSPLLVKPPRQGTSGQKDEPESKLNSIQMAGIVGGSSVLVVVGICCYGRRTKWKLCKGCKTYVDDVYKVARHPMMTMNAPGLERTTKKRTNQKRDRSSAKGSAKRSARRGYRAPKPMPPRAPAVRLAADEDSQTSDASTSRTVEPLIV